MNNLPVAAEPPLRHCWFSPFPQPSACLIGLERAGLEMWPGDPEAVPPGALLLYDAPDAVLASWRQQQASPPQWQNLHQGYQLLLGLATDRPPLASWRVAGLNPHGLSDWLSSQAALLPDPGSIPKVDLVAALLIRPLLQAEPKLLDAYLDLELKAELAGGSADSNYLARLQSQLSPGALLAAWWQPCTEAREEAEQMLLQLHQVQEELEQLFLADRNKQQQINALQTSNQQLEEQVPEIQAELEKANNELAVTGNGLAEAQQQLADVREEAELTLLQLHQVQEELEHYFLLSRRQLQLLDSHEQLELRSERLLADLINR